MKVPSGMHLKLVKNYSDCQVEFCNSETIHYLGKFNAFALLELAWLSAECYK